METGGRFSSGYALIVGVGRTVDPYWALPSTVADVLAIHATLTDPDTCAYPNDPQHVRLLFDKKATRQAILDGLGWLEEVSSSDSEATIIVYFSGHGRLLPETGEYFLIPHDFVAHDVRGSALDSRAFGIHLKRIRARRLLVILDSCYSGWMATAKDGPQHETSVPLAVAALPESVAVALKAGEGRALFASSTRNQLSWLRPDASMSIYTYRLIEALHGAASGPAESVVRVSHLIKHLAETVPADVQTFHQQEQVPYFDMASEDFPVAMLAARHAQHAVDGFRRRGEKRRVADSRTTGVSFSGSGDVTIHGDVVGGDQTKRQ